MMRKKSPAACDGIRAAIEALPDPQMSEMASALRADARERGFFLCHAGVDEVIPIAMNPCVVSREAARYLKGFFRRIRKTVNCVLEHYFEDPALQTILPLRESELRWLKSGCQDGIPRLQTVFERFDTNLGLSVDDQIDSFQIIEFNAVGVGCIYLMPAATELWENHLMPRVKTALPDLALAAPSDYRQLLLDDLKSHSDAMDRPACRIALVERREAIEGGTDEFARIMPFFQAKGFRAVLGDPREVEHKENEFFMRGEPVDVLYRDFQLEEVVSIKTHGGSVDGVEAAFAQNRVISTVFGEFDHKSLCELFTNPEFARYFRPQELRAARKRFPWTRLIAERRTTDPDGKEIDLIPLVKERRETLVLKPNRGYGGEGVVVGGAVTQAEWEQALERAVSKPNSWVAQQKVQIHQSPVLVLKSSGRPKLEERYVTLSVTATPRGIAFVGRCSTDPVVNISQGGALVPVFLSGR